jgi:hypothetical protein
MVVPTSWASDVVLIFFPVYGEPKKHHPHLRPSDQWRLTFDDLMVLSDLQLDEGVLILTSWATIASWPMCPFHFFTDVSPTDVTGTESGLVRYSFHNCYFHRAYK